MSNNFLGMTQIERARAELHESAERVADIRLKVIEQGNVFDNLKEEQAKREEIFHQRAVYLAQLRKIHGQ